MRVLSLVNGKVTSVEVTNITTAVGGASAVFIFLPFEVVGGCDASGN